jgi:amino acid adenylation domain-containing protein
VNSRGSAIDRLTAQERRALLAEVLLQRQTTGRRAPTSFAQRRLWFLEQLNPGSAAYTVPVGMQIDEDVDPEIMRRALAALVARHETLRTTFAAVDGEPVQLIAPRGTLPMETVDLRHLGEAAAAQEIDRLFRAETARVFDLAHGPLAGATCIRRTGGHPVLLLTLHHIVCDAWSLNVLFGEIRSLCAAFVRGEPATLAPLPIQYADFAMWQRGALAGATYARQAAYWRAQLADAPRRLDLPTDRPARVNPAPPAGMVPIAIEGALYTQLDAIARAEGVTLFMALLAVFALLLRRYTGQDDLLVGAPVANRGRAELEGLIGFFTNTLVLRIGVPARGSFRDLLRRTRAVALEAYAHQDLPFEKLVEELQPERDLTRNPLFQVLFAVQDQRGRGAGTPAAGAPVATGGAKFALTMTLVADSERLAGSLEYNADLFDAATAQRMTADYLTLLDGALQGPDRSLARLPLGIAGSDGQPKDDTTRAYESGLTLHACVERQARRSPRAIAVEDRDGRLSYRDLDDRATRLARRLRALGVRADVPVAVCVERSIELMVSLLAVLKAGGAFVPIDHAYGPERVAHMLRHSGAPLIIVQPALRAALPPHDAITVTIRPGGADTEEGPLPKTGPPLPRVDPAQLAYVIYTSGSTGRPKGVMIDHAAICNHVLWMLEQWPLTSADAVLQKTSTSFDASIWELFVPLAAGARLVMLPPGSHRDSRELVRWIRDREITVVQFVPSLLQAIVEEPELAECRRLRLLFCGGEALPAALARRVAAHSTASVVNLYGPTEVTIDATSWTYDPSDPAPVVPIGRPIANLRAYVLDQSLERVPIGAIGQLYMSGAGVGRGYLASPGGTAGRFLPDRFAATPGARMYATGDLVRQRVDGRLEFLARVDHQIKLRGHRIELEEIDQVLMAHPVVRGAVTVLRGDAPNQHLVAYLTGHADRDLDAALPALRDHLRAHLPEWMEPATLVPLAQMPTTANGKIDRHALPVPEAPLAARAHLPPRDDIERTVSDTWSLVLGVTNIGLDDGFFALGGHSLAATRVASRLRDALRMEVPLRAFFEHTTLRALADHLRALRPHDAPAIAEPGVMPGQRRVWLAQQIDPDGVGAQHDVRIEIPPDVDAALVQRRLADLAARHPILSATFPSSAGHLTLRADGGSAPTFTAIDLRPFAEARRRATEIERLCERERVGPFAIAAGPLLRVTRLQTGDAHDLLLLVAHAIVLDHVSLQHIAAALGAPREQSVDEVVTTEWLSSVAAWRRTVAATPSLIEAWRARWDGWRPMQLPADRPRPLVREHLAHAAAFALARESVEALLATARASGAEPRDAGLALVAALLHAWTGAADLAVALHEDGRDDHDTAAIIGPLATPVPVRVTLTPADTFTALLSNVVRARREALADGGAIAALVEETAGGHDAIRPTAAGVALHVSSRNRTGGHGGRDEPEGSSLRRDPMSVATAPSMPPSMPPLDVLGGTELSVRLHASPEEGVGGLVICAADVFDAASATAFASALATLGDALALSSQPARDWRRLVDSSGDQAAGLPSVVHAAAPEVSSPTEEPMTPLVRHLRGLWRTPDERHEAGMTWEQQCDLAARLGASVRSLLDVDLPPRRALAAESLTALALDLLDAALARQEPDEVEDRLNELEQLTPDAAWARRQVIDARGLS